MCLFMDYEALSVVDNDEVALNCVINCNPEDFTCNTKH